MSALLAAKFAALVRNKGAYLPGIGVAPTGKTDAPIGAGVTFEISKRIFRTIACRFQENSL